MEENIMIEDNKYVVLHYVGSLENGKVFDTSINRPPFEFQMGTHKVIKGFEDAVRDMNVNDEKEVVIPPELAYGEIDERKKKYFPIEDIRKNFEPEVGMSIGIKMDNGAQVPAVVLDVNDDQVLIDMNHPFAGKTLKFKLILLEINDEPKYSLGNACICGENETCEM